MPPLFSRRRWFSSLTRCGIAAGILAALPVAAQTAPALSINAATAPKKPSQTQSDSPFYMRLIYGQGQASRQSDIDAVWRAHSGTNERGALQRTRTDESAGVRSLQIGRRINPFLATEMGYLDLGQSSYDAVYEKHSERLTVSALGLNFGLVGLLPVEALAWSLRAKLGLAALAVTQSGAEDTMDGGGGKTSFSPYWGLGLSQHMGEGFAVSAEYTLYQSVGNSTSTRGNIAAFTLSLDFGF